MPRLKDFYLIHDFNHIFDAECEKNVFIEANLLEACNRF